MKERRTKKRFILIIVVATIALILISAMLFYNGILSLNNPSHTKYPVRGVDVSTYQGEIDWSLLAGQNIQFAFIKATEGSSFIDSHFAQNFENATKTNLKVGAYHFFSYDSPGKDQADNFIAVVPAADNMLPPVVDVEFYGDKAKNPPEKDLVVKELFDILVSLENHYGIKPIIYATEKSYALYISGDFGEYDIWIRNVRSYPSLSDKRSWTFWQYTNRELLDGYNGEEKYIDMNVFNGTQSEFDSY